MKYAAQTLPVASDEYHLQKDMVMTLHHRHCVAVISFEDPYVIENNFTVLQ